MIDKSKRWPVIVISILLVTVGVNIAFAWVAIRDQSGGFEMVNGGARDASYKFKVPLEKR